MIVCEALLAKNKLANHTGKVYSSCFDVQEDILSSNSVLEG